MRSTPQSAGANRWIFRTLSGRIILGLGLAAGLALVAGGIIAGSLWIEHRHPSDDPQRTLLPDVQRVVTRPVAQAVGRQLARAVHAQATARYRDTGLTLAETIDRFLDERLDLNERRECAYRLAEAGTPAALAALLKVLSTAPPEQKAFMAQLIGSTGNPAALAALYPLLDHPDARVVQAAVRGLCVIGGADVTARVAAILDDGQQPVAVRIAAAQGLARIGTPAAREALVAAFANVAENAVAAAVLGSLGRFPYASIGPLFRDYLATPAVPASLRVAATEALANSTPDAVPFLAGLAGADAEAEVRAAAAWAISTHQTVNDLAPALTLLAERETDEDVRRRLYEALLPQQDIAGDRLLPLVLAETDIAARVAGFNALGRAARQEPASAAAATFDSTVVPELMRIATNPNSLNIQMRAVFALRRAQTPAAQAALTTISQQAPPQVAAAARHGLPATNG